MKVPLLVVGLLLVFTPVAGAAPQDVANRISSEIMSPFCPGVTLHDCASDSAVALRERITAMAEAGYGRDAIMAELEREYGPTIRAVPEARGSGLLAWLLPVAATGSAVVVAWVLLRRWAHDPAPVDGYDEDVHITPEDRRRLDVELAKLRGNP